MFLWFASKRAGSAATKIEQRPLSSRLWSQFKYFFLFPAIIVTALWSWTYLQHNQLFPVSTVKVVDPGSHIDQQQLKTMITPALQQGFLWFKVADMEAQLETMPWVSHATIERQWPNTLVIQLDEYKPVASWNKSNLIATDGTVFLPGSKDLIPAQLPVLNGPQEDAKSILQWYEAMQKSLAKVQLQITEVDVSDSLSWLIKLNNGMQINLGQTQPLNRLNEFVAVYPEVFTNNSEQAVYVDMRYDHGMAVHWQQQNAKKAGSS